MTKQDYMDMNTAFNSNVDPSAFSTGVSLSQYVETSTASAAQVTITTTNASNALYPISVYINNAQLPVLYSVASNVITLASALNLSDKILVVYYA